MVTYQVDNWVKSGLNLGQGSLFQTEDFVDQLGVWSFNFGGGACGFLFVCFCSLFFLIYLPWFYWANNFFLWWATCISKNTYHWSCLHFKAVYLIGICLRCKNNSSTIQLFNLKLFSTIVSQWKVNSCWTLKGLLNSWFIFWLQTKLRNMWDIFEIFMMFSSIRNLSLVQICPNFTKF